MSADVRVLPDEEWRPVLGGLYEVSDQGRVRRRRLSWEQVHEIRRATVGADTAMLARFYGVNATTIRDIRAGRTWTRP